MRKHSSFWIVPVTALLCAAPALAAEKREVTQEAFACSDQKTLIRIMELQISDGDTKAAAALLDKARASHDCLLFNLGDQIYVEKGDPDNAGWICARPVGDPSCYWTHSVVVRKR